MTLLKLYQEASKAVLRYFSVSVPVVTTLAAAMEQGAMNVARYCVSVLVQQSDLPMKTHFLYTAKPCAEIYLNDVSLVKSYCWPFPASNN
jgi:hypothetical protein